MFLLVFIVVPMAILVVLAVRNIKPWNPRYVAVVFPFLLLLLSLGLTRLPGAWSRGISVLMVILSFWSLAGHYWNDRYSKADIRGAEQYVQLQNTTADEVFVPVVTGVYRFYSGDKTILVDSFNHPPLRSERDATEFFKTKLGHLSKVWFVSSREWYFDPKGYLPVVFSRNGRLRLENSLPGVKIYHWDRTAETGDNHEH